MKRTNPFGNQPPKANVQQSNNNQDIHKLPPSSSSVSNNPPMSNGPRPFNGVAQAYSNPMQQQQEAQLSPFDIALKEYESLKQFNATSEFLSPTTTVFPSTHNLLKEISFPIGLQMSPLTPSQASLDIPQVSYGEQNIPRCMSGNCRAYINPFIKWIQGGEKWICNICKTINNTDEFYYAELDQAGNRIDMMDRPELCTGSYEFIANKTYWKEKKTPTEAFFIFLIETSSSAVLSGYLTAVIESIKDVINNELFFNGSRTKVAFVTYDTSIHFYACNSKITQPQMFCVTEEEVYLPTIREHLIFNIEENKESILTILEMIQKTFNNTASACKDSNRLFSSIQGASLLARGRGGKMIVFSSSNTVHQHAKMIGGLDPKIPREQTSLTATDKKVLGNLGINLTNDNICCDLFVTAEKDINLITLNQLCEYSNGTLFFYKSFKFDLHYKNIFNQIRRVLSKAIGWEGVMRTRFSHGYKISEFLTPVLLSNRDLFVFPTTDSDQHYQICLDIINPEGIEVSNLTLQDPFIFIQSALLYSYGDGTRRIRIHNLCLPISTRAKDIYDGINGEILSTCYLKQTIDKIYKTKNISNSIISTETLFKTFINCIMDNQQSMQKVLPDNLLYVILYTLGIIKHRVFCKDEIERKYNIDLSNYLRLKLQRTSMEETMNFILPNIYSMHSLLYDKSIGVLDEMTGMIKLPNTISTRMSSFETDGLYLIDNGYLLVLYVKMGIDKAIAKSLFEVEELQFMTMNVSEETVFGEVKDEFKERVMNIIDYIRGSKSLYQNMIFVFENTDGEKLIKESLIEDNFCPWYTLDYKSFYDKTI